MNNRKNLSKFKPHLFESFVVYAIVFFVLGSLKIFASNFLDKYSYVITAITIAVIAIVIWVLTKRKEKVKIKQLEEEKENLRAAKWNFLLEKDESEQIAILNLFKVARIKGLYEGEALQNEIKCHFLKAKKVKIKVTRGYNIFIDDGSSSEKDIFHHCIRVEGKDQERDIELLLHFPCLKNKHTAKRARANKVSVEEYIDTVFDVLKEIKNITNSKRNKNDISVRFYDDYAIRWRYYLFVDAKTNDKTLLLNYYDDSKSGADSAMLKVEFGAGTLCQDFDKRFDQIFSDEDYSKEIISNTKSSSRLVTKSICGHEKCIEKIEQLHLESFNNSRKA